MITFRSGNKPIHVGLVVTCLMATEFQKLIDRLQTAEKDLAKALKRVTLLEETLKITESEYSKLVKFTENFDQTNIK